MLKTNEQLKKEIEEGIDAKLEEMLLFQILEEHIKGNKSFEPCQTCIRLAINKGYKLGRKLRRK